MAYKGIVNVSSEAKKEDKIKKRSLHFFASAFLCLSCIACVNLSIIGFTEFGDYVKRITLNWTPKPEDMGKIKFVNFSFDSLEKGDGIFIVSSPFKNYYAKNIDDATLRVNGLGDVILLSPVDGKISSIEYSKNKCEICICSGNVIVKLSGVDYACVSVGEVVKSEQKIGVCLDSFVTFNIICNGKAVDLVANGREDTFFE